LKPTYVVVGAGVIGATTALRLAETGAHVTVLDAEGPCAGTSSTSFAWVGASALGLWDYFEINVAGTAAYRRLQAELGPLPWHVANGSLVWYSDGGAQETLLARVAELRDAGYPAALLTPARVRELEPALKLADTVEQVAFYSDEGYVLARAMVADILLLAEQRGVTTRFGARVTGLEPDASRPAVVLADGERIEADAVVLCGGRWTSELARLAGATVPMLVPSPGSLDVGLLVRTAPIAETVSRMLLADDLMIRPDGGAHLLLHSDEHDRTVDPQSGPQALAPIAEDVVDVALGHLALSARPVVESAVIGLRALTTDYLPAVGWLPGADGIYAAVTHSGITLAPVLGELIAAEVALGADERLLRPFRHERFASAGTPTSAGTASIGETP